PAVRRVPVRLRGGAHGAGRRPLRAQPDAREGRSHPRGAALMAEIVLMRNFGRADSHTLAGYRATGGYGGWEKARTLEPAAVKEAYDAGLLGAGFDIVVHRGAGAYICGEETGLLSSLEGKKGWPKIKPPFPAIKGAFGQPTIVNNVETLACVPPIITRGAQWFAGLGTKTQGGTRMYSVS